LICLNNIWKSPEFDGQNWSKDDDLVKIHPLHPTWILESNGRLRLPNQARATRATAHFPHPCRLAKIDIFRASPTSHSKDNILRQERALKAEVACLPKIWSGHKRVEISMPLNASSIFVGDTSSNLVSTPQRGNSSTVRIAYNQTANFVFGIVTRSLTCSTSSGCRSKFIALGWLAKQQAWLGRALKKETMT